MMLVLNVSVHLDWILSVSVHYQLHADIRHSFANTVLQINSLIIPNTTFSQYDESCISLRPTLFFETEGQIPLP